jgi:hypothetical protein
MRTERNRPYFNKSIAQFEALLELPGLDNQHFSLSRAGTHAPHNGSGF